MITQKKVLPFVTNKKKNKISVVLSVAKETIKYVNIYHDRF